MMAMVSVLESALTVSPARMSTETTVPLIGLVSVASFNDCCALVSWASAVSIAAWSLAICSGESELRRPRGTGGAGAARPRCRSLRRRSCP